MMRKALTGSSLPRVMVCHMFGVKPLPEPKPTYCQLDPRNVLQKIATRRPFQPEEDVELPTHLALNHQDDLIRRVSFQSMLNATQCSFHQHELTGITTWMSNYIRAKRCDVLTHPCPYRMSNYIPLFYMDVITYPFSVCYNIGNPPKPVLNIRVTS